MKNSKKNMKRRSVFSVKVKPFIKELPDVCRKIPGEGFCLYPVKGDGSCGPRCAAAWIFHDQSLGPYLARNINMDFVQNWEFWEPFFTFPFVRQMGNGKSTKCENKEELFDFLMNSSKGAYMWRGHEDFLVISNVFQVRIKLITMRNAEDENPSINVIEPKHDVSKTNGFPGGVVPEMILLHEEDSHYNLIVPKDHFLATEGGFDYQRQVNIVSGAELEKEEQCSPEVNIGKFLSPPELIERIDVLEKELHLLGARCKSLEADNKNLRDELSKEDLDSPSDEEVLLKSKQGGFERCSPQVQSAAKPTELEYPCHKCNYKFNSKGLLTAHQETHEETIYSCDECGQTFKLRENLEKHMKNHKLKSNHCKFCEATFETKSSLENHIKKHGLTEHFCDLCNRTFETKTSLDYHIRTAHREKKEKETTQYNCDDCPFQGESGLQLKKHVHITGHIPAKYEEVCYTCKNVFESYWHLMNHRKNEHPSIKNCRYFLKDMCSFDAVDCWYKHEKKSEANSNIEEHSFDCRECDYKTKSRSELMRHIKTEHKKSVPVCRDYIQGHCDLSESYCWFTHTVHNNKATQEEESSPDDSVFHEAQKKTRPDPIYSLIEMVQKLTLQVEKLEKRTQNL